MAKRRQKRGLPTRTATAFSRTERSAIIRRTQSLRGPAKSFMAEIVRQARQARGRVDDDVYGVVRATLEALAHNRGKPPPIVFAVSHYQTGRVEQVGFLSPGVRDFPRQGRFITNDPRFTRRRLTGVDPSQLPGTPLFLEDPDRGVE